MQVESRPPSPEIEDSQEEEREEEKEEEKEEETVVKKGNKSGLSKNPIGGKTHAKGKTQRTSTS